MMVSFAVDWLAIQTEKKKEYNIHILVKFAFCHNSQSSRSGDFLTKKNFCFSRRGAPIFFFFFFFFFFFLWKNKKMFVDNLLLRALIVYKDDHCKRFLFQQSNMLYKPF